LMRFIELPPESEFVDRSARAADGSGCKVYKFDGFCCVCHPRTATGRRR
jgi:hypothetical protein